MSDQNTPLTESAGRSLVVQSQKMAAALSSYARALTFENRSRRNLYRLAGLTPRFRDKIFARLLVASFICCFVLPLGLSVVYFGLLASKVYVSEVRFVLRSSAPMLSRDRFSSETVEPKAKIVQDTAIALNYLDSPAIVQDLREHMDFEGFYARPEIDFIARLDSEATQEEVLDYWSGKYSSWVNPKSGIVELEVHAYSPEEAHELMEIVLELAEQRVNQLSAGMWDGLMTSARLDVDAASAELTALRDRYRDLQNQTGIYDVSLAADGLVTVLTGLESELASLKARRAALAESVDRSAPQFQELDRQVAAQEVQIAALKSEAAGQDGETLAGHSRKFEDLQLELDLAEQRLASAIRELEKVRLVSSLQLVYLDAFTEPTQPDTHKYPNVPLSLLLAFLASAVLWGSVSGIIILIRNKLD
ncbi:hypothetical protein GCM10011316_36510 [Roseibium aquae]|uniref:Capsular polysaccharide transport system permease protein n=1 Tax=Roseibium aquae TaxID=1323746 RepID=A0A916TN44_9HYPH|nr:hypothetical protein [Roseibium aquae]GGB61223.1 hypothetical protein GCM10011316_36510 [Roseibium aquae]